MKTATLILLIASCVLVRGVAYASVTSPAPQQSSGNSAITDAGSDHSGAPEHATVLSQSKDQKKAMASDERTGRRRVSSKIRPHRLPTPSKSNRPKQVLLNQEHSRRGNIAGMHQQVLTKSAGTASKVVRIHTLPVRPVTGVAISGQPFRNGRNRSATPTVIGGPANTRRNPEAINGTEVNRKHLY